MGGFDGDVETTKGSAYIPKGKCILEFGTNKDFKTKAEGDYATRSENDYEGLSKSETTFIFMTPRCWGNKKNGKKRRKRMVFGKMSGFMIVHCLCNGFCLSLL